MIALLKPYMPDLPEMDFVLHSGALAYGKYTKEFEDKLKEYFATPYVIVTNSFGMAVSVAITTLGLSYEDEVIVSPMGCLVSTQPYLTSGLKIKWCDIDPKKGTLDPDCLRKAITTKTKAIIHNHFCGYPGYIDEINFISKEYGIPVIDDGIECFGSEYKGKRIGNCGSDVTIFSLGPVRIPNTIEGGVVIFKEKRLYEKSLRIRDCGINRISFRDDIGEINPQCDISELGYSATMSNVNGYIGSCQMAYVDELLAKQRRNAIRWNARLLPTDFDFIEIEDAKPNYWVYGILCDNKRDTVLDFRAKGFYASGVHMKNNIYSVFGNNKSRKLSGVDEFYKRFVALPCGWWINDNEI